MQVLEIFVHGEATLCPEVDHRPTEMTQIPVKTVATGNGDPVMFSTHRLALID